MIIDKKVWEVQEGSNPKGSNRGMAIGNGMTAGHLDSLNQGWTKAVLR